MLPKGLWFWDLEGCGPAPTSPLGRNPMVNSDPTFLLSIAQVETLGGASTPALGFCLARWSCQISTTLVPQRYLVWSSPYFFLLRIPSNDQVWGLWLYKAQGTRWLLCGGLLPEECGFVGLTRIQNCSQIVYNLAEWETDLRRPGEYSVV